MSPLIETARGWCAPVTLFGAVSLMRISGSRYTRATQAPYPAMGDRRCACHRAKAWGSGAQRRWDPMLGARHHEAGFKKVGPPPFAIFIRLEQLEAIACDFDGQERREYAEKCYQCATPRGWAYAPVCYAGGTLLRTLSTVQLNGRVWWLRSQGHGFVSRRAQLLLSLHRTFHLRTNRPFHLRRDEMPSIDSAHASVRGVYTQRARGYHSTSPCADRAERIPHPSLPTLSSLLAVTHHAPRLSPSHTPSRNRCVFLLRCGAARPS